MTLGDTHILYQIYISYRSNAIYKLDHIVKVFPLNSLSIVKSHFGVTRPLIPLYPLLISHFNKESWIQF